MVYANDLKQAPSLILSDKKSTHIRWLSTCEG